MDKSVCYDTEVMDDLASETWFSIDEAVLLVRYAVYCDRTNQECPVKDKDVLLNLQTLADKANVLSLVLTMTTLSKDPGKVLVAKNQVSGIEHFINTEYGATLEKIKNFFANDEDIPRKVNIGHLSREHKKLYDQYPKSITKK